MNSPKSGRIVLPTQFAISESILQNPIRRVAQGDHYAQWSGNYWERRGIKGLSIDDQGKKILLVAQRIQLPGDFDEVLQIPETLIGDAESGATELDATLGRWLRPRPLNLGPEIDTWVPL